MELLQPNRGSDDDRGDDTLLEKSADADLLREMAGLASSGEFPSSGRSYFPAFLKPRRTAEKALAAVIHEVYVQGVSTRSVDELVKAMGMTGISGASQSDIYGVPYK